MLGVVALIGYFFGHSTRDPAGSLPSDYQSVAAQAPQALYQAQEPVQADAVADAPIYFANCSQARAAGAAPVREGNPGYARHLDRDGDGVGCE